MGPKMDQTYKLVGEFGGANICIEIGGREGWEWYLGGGVGRCAFFLSVGPCHPILVQHVRESFAMASLDRFVVSLCKLYLPLLLLFSFLHRRVHSARHFTVLLFSHACFPLPPMLYPGWPCLGTLLLLLEQCPGTYMHT
jgi:hypothetical protein